MTEKNLALVLENALNSYSFNYKKVADEVPNMHRTIQQNLYKLCRAIIETIGSEDYKFDERNQIAHEECKIMLQYLKENGRNIPLI